MASLLYSVLIVAFWSIGAEATTPTPTPTYAICPQEIQLTASQGPPGLNVGLSGRCYYIHSGASANVYFDDTIVGRVTGDTPGNYSTSITIPLDITNGRHIIQIRTGASLIGRAEFEVIRPICPGDCNGDGRVTVNEIIEGVGILLGRLSLPTCSSLDQDANGEISIAEVVGAVNAALEGCLTEAPRELSLINARDHIEGSFVGSRAVYADATRIYLASFQGELFVLARDRAAGFPVLEVRRDGTAPLTAVRGDGEFLYVAGGNGELLIYRTTPQLPLEHRVQLGPLGLSGVEVVEGKIYVGIGQASFAVDSTFVFHAALNEGENVVELDPTDFSVVRTFVGTPHIGYTQARYRYDASLVSELPNPPTVSGEPSFANLFAGDRILAHTIPGCCGSGIYLRDALTLALTHEIPRAFTNTVRSRGRWLFAGNEGGQVDAFDLYRDGIPIAASIDLRSVTGHTGSEDIEIRALWTDDVDNLIFAASSWGNDTSRGPDLPSFFVLELSQP